MWGGRRSSLPTRSPKANLTRSGGAGNRIAGGATEPDPTGANGGIGDDAMAPIAPDGDRSIPPKDDSGTIRASPRRLLILALASAVGAAEEAGDSELAEFATETLRALLDSAGG